MLILDQLDALCWTQAHSGDALNVCLQIIEETEKFNRTREEKISIIFVCRTYDLENDSNIRNLFRQDKKDIYHLNWEKIQIQNLTDEEVTNILGEKSSVLSPKLRELVRIPSNLYILEQLDIQKCRSPITTTHDLVTEWWNQLLEKAVSVSLSEQLLETVKEKILAFCESKGRIYAPLAILKTGKSYVDFLRSNGFILIQDNKVSFVHQSILDCFLCEHMMGKYYAGENLENIVGSIQKQDPGKRYQVQMFLQRLLEISTEDFMDAGKQLLISPGVHCIYQNIYIRKIFFYKIVAFHRFISQI